MYCVCWCDLDPIQGQGQGHGPFELPTIAHKCTIHVYLLRHFCVELKTDGWYWQYGAWSIASRRPVFEFPSRKGITGVQTSRNVDISRHSNGHIFRYWVMLQSHGWDAGSPTYTAYVDMTLTRSKVMVKVTGLLNFRQLAKPCMLAAMTAAPLRGFLVVLIFLILYRPLRIP